MLLIIVVGREKLNLSNIDEKNFKSVWLPLKMLSLQRLKQKFFLYRSTDRYDTKPPTTTVTRLPFSFDANELEPWNVELWRLKNFCENFTNQIIFSLFKVPIKHIQEKAKEKEIWLQRKMNIFLSQLLFNCNIEKKKIKIFYVKFAYWA